MKYVIFVIILLFSLKCPALSLESGGYATIHFKESRGYNSIGDNRTTLNPMVRLNTENMSFYYFKDSINSEAYGVNYLLRKNSGIFNYGLTIGGYLIDTNKWKSYYQFWLDSGIGGKGFIPVLGPELNIELYKYDKFVINNHSILSVAGYFSTGLFLEWRF